MQAEAKPWSAPEPASLTEAPSPARLNGRPGLELGTAPGTRARLQAESGRGTARYYGCFRENSTSVSVSLQAGL